MLLGDLVSIDAGYPFRSSVSECPGAGVRAVQMRDVSPGDGVCWAGTIETELPGKRQPDWLQPGDILFAIRGNHNYAALIGEHIGDIKAVASPHFFVLRCPGGKVLPEYLCWLLNQGPLQRYFKAESEGSVTKSIRRAVLEQAPVVVPPLERQRAIIALAECARKQNQLHEQLIKNNEAAMNCIAADLLDTEKEGGLSR